MEAMRSSSEPPTAEVVDPGEPSSDAGRHLVVAGELLRLLASADGAESVHLDGAFAVVSGVGSNTENGIVGALSSGADRGEKIAALIGLVRRRNVPGSWLLVQPQEAGDDLTDALVAGGCRAEDDAWVMGGSVMAPAPVAPQGVRITPVATAAGLEDWLRVAEVCGWIETPEELAVRRRVYGALPFDGAWRRWTATRDGAPVGMAAALVSGDTLFLTDSAVVPDARRRGVGRALALTRLQFGSDNGCARAVLAPSPDGAELWRSLGFVESRQPPRRWFHLPSTMPATREIAYAREDETAAILALHREAGWPGTHVDGEVWVTREAGQLVASAQVIELEPSLVLVDAVVVRTSARNRGIGAELVRAVLASRATHWWLECRRERVAFYQRLGFAVVDEAEVPLVVKAGVGGNHGRRQCFLHGSTISRVGAGDRDSSSSA